MTILEIEAQDAGWQKVKFADEMPMCHGCEEEALCEEHQMHFSDCPCIGPTQDGVEYKVVDGVLFGRIVPAP